jgi:hypothetical protein
LEKANAVIAERQQEIKGIRTVNGYPPQLVGGLGNKAEFQMVNNMKIKRYLKFYRKDGE